MDTESARKFLQHAGGRNRSGVGHRQCALVCILVTLLLFSFAAHMAELDVALVRMLAGLGRDCVWCTVTPY